MIWTDVLVGADVPDHILRTGLAAAFTIAADDVVLVDGVEDLPDRYPLAAVRDRIGGPQFPLQLSIYLPEPDPVAAHPVSNTLRRLAAEWDTPLLTADDNSDDPYRYRLYTADGNETAVSVDPLALDERDEYLVS